MCRASSFRPTVYFQWSQTACCPETSAAGKKEKEQKVLKAVFLFLFFFLLTPPVCFILGSAKGQRTEAEMQLLRVPPSSSQQSADCVPVSQHPAASPLRPLISTPVGAAAPRSSPSAPLRRYTHLTFSCSVRGAVRAVMIRLCVGFSCLTCVWPQATFPPTLVGPFLPFSSSPARVFWHLPRPSLINSP